MLSKTLADHARSLGTGSYTRRVTMRSTVKQKTERAISFVVARISDSYLYNFARSPVVGDAHNELVLVENPGGLRFSSVSQAINAGLDKARHELIVVAQESVCLPRGWQAWLEAALTALESQDADWGLVGCSGWTASGEPAGHCSFPGTYLNTFSENETFVPVDRVDDQVLVFRKAMGLKLDPRNPGLPGTGKDLSRSVQSRGGHACYVVNAPVTCHYRNDKGQTVRKMKQLPDAERADLHTYRAEQAVCNGYVDAKWERGTDTPSGQGKSRGSVPDGGQYRLEGFPDRVMLALDSPVVLIAKGGGGSRLLSLAAQDCGVFLGNDLNKAADCMDLVPVVYQGVIAKYKCPAFWRSERFAQQLRFAAATMLAAAPDKDRKSWGFKIPECLLLLPEIERAFPGARYVQLLRDPVSTCLRGTHITASLDNQIGRITLPQAYAYAGRPAETILQDSPALHMAYTTLHQLKMSISYCREHFPESQYCEMRFEDLMNAPAVALDTLSTWLGCTPTSGKLHDAVDFRRASNPRVRYSDAITAQVQAILAPVTDIL